MKNAICLTGLFFALTAFTACNLGDLIDSGHHHDDEVIVATSETPACIQDFVNTHFNGIAIARIKKDINDYDYYSARLANGFELEFSKDCEWLDVDCHRSAVPQTILDLLPAEIMQYINANYSNRTVRSIDKERYGYEIELNGDIDLEFDLDGKFLRVDR